MVFYFVPFACKLQCCFIPNRSRGRLSTGLESMLKTGFILNVSLSVEDKRITKARNQSTKLKDHKYHLLVTQIIMDVIHSKHNMKIGVKTHCNQGIRYFDSRIIHLH